MQSLIIASKQVLTVLLDEIYEYEFGSLFTYLFETIETRVRGGTAFCVTEDEGLSLELLYFGVGESFDRLPKIFWVSGIVMQNYRRFLFG